MKSKRLLMPLLVLGIFLTLGNMVYAQTSPVTCSLVIAANDVGASGTALAAASVPAAPLLPGPSAHATSTGHTEPIGAGPTEVSGTVGTGQTSGTGTLRVKCINPTGGPQTPGVGILVISMTNNAGITNTQTWPTAFAGIRISNSTGAFVAPTYATSAGPTTNTLVTNNATANVGIGSVSNSASQIVIGLGTPIAVSSTTSPQSPSTGITFAANTTSTFDLQGVLVSTNGKTGEVDATMTDISGAYTIGTNLAAVVTTISPALTDPTVPSSGLPTAATTSAGCPAAPTNCTGGAAVLNSNGTALKGNFTVRLQENYADMWKASGTAGPGFNSGGVFPISNSSATTVLLKFSGIPAGVTVSNCSAIITDVNGNGTVGSPTATASLTSTANIMSIDFNAEPDQTNIDVLWITCATITATTLPLPSTPVTVQAEMGPEGAALSSLGAALTGLSTGLIPRYQAAYQPTAGVTVIVFPPSNTTMLLTFATVIPGYDTGIAIANTSTDPFTPAGGGATSSNGTIVFSMYKNGDTSAPKVYTTTTGSPGIGLTAAGVLNAGNTYAVPLSTLLTAAGYGPTFTGYIFITANFTNAHGAATIYLTSTGDAALSSPVLLLPAVSTAAQRPAIDLGGGLGQ